MFQYRERIIENLNLLDGHIYEIQQELRKRGVEDNLDVFWSVELIKNTMELVNSMKGE